MTLFLCGDVMLGRGIDQALPHSVDPKIYEPAVTDARDYLRLAQRMNGPFARPLSYGTVWGDAKQIWRSMKPDFKLVNLETAVTGNDEPWPRKGINYRMHPQNIDVLTTVGIDYCSLANNHVLDWEYAGLEETLRTIEGAGIAYSGAGRNLDEAGSPAILKRGDGKRVLVFAFGSGSSGVPEEWAATEDRSGLNYLAPESDRQLEAIAKRIKAAKEPGDIVVFSVHWGPNWGYAVSRGDRRFAHRLVDEAGVDIVFGHSSHHPRGIEVYKGKLVLYGAGDFLNDYEGIGGEEEFRGDLTLMYFPSVRTEDGSLEELRLFPLEMRQFRLHRASFEDTKWVCDLLNREGAHFGTKAVLNDDGSLSLDWKRE